MHRHRGRRLQSRAGAETEPPWARSVWTLARTVRVHHDDSPIPVLRCPGKRLDAGAERVRDPEVFAGRRSWRRPSWRRRKSLRAASKRVATSRRTPARYESTDPAGPIPTNSGCVLSVRTRTVPSMSRATNRSPATPVRVTVRDECIGAGGVGGRVRSSGSRSRHVGSGRRRARFHRRRRRRVLENPDAGDDHGDHPPCTPPRTGRGRSRVAR